MGNVIALALQIPSEIAQYWGWFLAFGIGLLLLGVAAVVRSVAATVVSMVFFGWLLVMASGIEIAQAVMVGRWVGVFPHLLAAILFGVVGLFMILRPVISGEVATVFMAFFFLVGGLFQLLAALIIAFPGWGWPALDGVVTFALGVLILAQWPASGLWVIGLFVGIRLILFGGSWIALALRLHTS